MTSTEKKAKRVALAKDALAQLEAGKFLPQFGSYCRYVPGEERCQVCAVGALMVTCCGAPGENIFKERAVECLQELFSAPELAIIEAAFEGHNDMPLKDLVEFDDEETLEEIDAASALFGEEPDGDDEQIKSDDARKRIAAIMTNIITNDGEFRP